MKKAIINLFCCCIPSATLRRRIRNAFLSTPFDEADLLDIGTRHIVKRGVRITVDVEESSRRFWTLYANNAWENRTFDMFDTYIDNGHDYLDIGAWIGPTALYGASRARKAYAFEPDKRAFEQCVKNRNLNPRLKEKLDIYNFGIGSENRKARFFIGKGASSMSSVIPNTANDSDSYPVDFFDIRTVISLYALDAQGISFVKMDIEGGEYDVLPSLTAYFDEIRHYPALFVSTHAPFLIDDALDDEKKRDAFAALNSKLLAALHSYPFLYAGKSRIRTADDLGPHPRSFDLLAARQRRPGR